MKLNSSKISADIIPVTIVTSNTLSNKLTEVFIENNKSSQLKDHKNEKEQATAPFYDELHFANYE